MNYNTEQIVKGIMRYADSEVMEKLPTSGQWIVGTFINLASDKVSNVAESLTENPIVKMLDIVDEDGLVDVDTLTEAIKSSADRYGKVTIEVPLVGKLTFSASDIDRLRTYIQ